MPLFLISFDKNSELSSSPNKVVKTVFTPAALMCLETIPAPPT